jgi:hypothetical protein
VEFFLLADCHPCSKLGNARKHIKACCSQMSSDETFSFGQSAVLYRRLPRFLTVWAGATSFSALSGVSEA